MTIAVFLYIAAIVFGLVAAFVSTPRVNLLAIAVALLAAGSLAELMQ